MDKFHNINERFKACLKKPKEAIQAFKDLYYVLKDLPKEVQHCDGVTEDLEKIVSKMLSAFNFLEFIKNLTNNIMFHSFSLVGYIGEGVESL